MTDRIRFVGVAIPDVSDYDQPLPSGKWSRFFTVLSQRMELAQLIQPQLPRQDWLVNMALNFNPQPGRWRAQAGFARRRAYRVSELVERELQQLPGSYDLVVQLQTLCQPGTRSRERPYVIYTDNTFALIQRFYRRWAPISSSRVERWLAFEREVCHAALTVFTFSEFARRSVIEDYGCDPSRVVAIGAGANQLPSVGSVEKPQRPLALFVGRPFELKGGPSLLRAWSAVRERIPDAELVIAGPRGGPPRRLPAGVSWAGRVDRRALDELYRSAGVFVLPTMFDAWGHVFVEAMAYGLPCIGTQCCAMPELIEDGVTGRLVPRGEAEPLADALIELLGDPGRSEAMGRLARDRVLEHLTWEHVGDRFMAQLAALRAEPSVAWP